MTEYFVFSHSEEDSAGSYQVTDGRGPSGQDDSDQDESLPPGEPDHVDTVVQQERLVAGQCRHDGEDDEGGVGEATGGESAGGDGMRGSDQFSGEIGSGHDPGDAGEDHSEDSEEIHVSLTVGTIPLITTQQICLEELVDTIVTI